MTGVALVTLGRSTLGEQRRIEAWRQLYASLDVPVSVVRLLADHAARPPVPSAQLLRALAAGHAVPEAALWDLVPVVRRLEALEPDLVVSVTARAFHPAFAQVAARTVVDLVDPLSESYRSRGRTDTSRARRVVYRSLTTPAARFERRALRLADACTAAGRAEAEALGVDWFPNLVGDGRAQDDARRDPDVDVVFFGTLSYPPNEDAVRALAGIWPDVIARRPGTTALVAGRGPSPSLVAAARALDWEVEADFPSVDALLARTRLAVAPLRMANGVQNKVLEAAAAGVAQVVSPEAVAGLDQDFPAEVARVGPAFAGAVAELLSDDDRRTALAAAARRHVVARYRPEAWQDLGRRLLGVPAPPLSGVAG